MSFLRHSVHAPSHLCLHIAGLFWSEAVCFSQHRHNVDLLIQGFHEVHINWFETETAQRKCVNWTWFLFSRLLKSWDRKKLKQQQTPVPRRGLTHGHEAKWSIDSSALCCLLCFYGSARSHFCGTSPSPDLHNELRPSSCKKNHV